MADSTPSLGGLSLGSETSAFEEGLRIGDLELVREIGRGGQAVVFEGRQGSLNRTVAVKILSRDFVNSDEQAARFQREAEATGRLTSPNIVAVYEYREVEGHSLIVEEFVPGKSLGDELDRRWRDRDRIDVEFCEWAADICRQLALALHHAHEHKIVHRDIKPDNVLMSKGRIPKIADFGLAKVEDAAGLSISGTILGTPYYMSPEQVDSTGGEIDPRTDVYSLGATLYRMLTNRVPVKSKNLEGIFLDILHRTPTPPRNSQPAVSRDLEAVCLKALEKLPQNRYQSAEEMADDLARYLAGEPTFARPVSGVIKAMRTLSRMATSSLWMVALLVPMVWLLVDAFLLGPLGTKTDGVVALRLGVVLLASGLLAWPLALLGVRLTSRRWTLAPAIVFSLALGSIAGWRVFDDRMTFRHEEARHALELVVELSERRDVEDIGEYISEWGDRFEEPDMFLVARAYLGRGRAALAERWVRAGQAENTSPVYTALLSAVATATGVEDVPTDASIWELPPGSVGWSEWKRIGDVFRMMTRYGDARRAYERSGSQPGADRDAINLSVARVYADLCQWDSAGERLRDVLHWKPEDPEANFLARRVAFARDDFVEAERHLEIFESNPETPLLVRLQRRYEFLEKSNNDEGAAAYLDQCLAEWGDEPEVIEWCAQATFAAARFREVELPTVAARGDMQAYGALIEELKAQFLTVDELFQRLRELAPDWSGADVGLCAINLHLARYLPEEGPERMNAAVEAGKRALTKDADYYQAHYNLALADFSRGTALPGGVDAASDEVLLEFVDRMETALALNSLSPQPMNDVAYIQGVLFQRTGDRAYIERAFDLIRRAIRLQVRESESRCAVSEAFRQLTSSLEDTLATLHERDGDLEAAVAAARRSVTALDADSGMREQRAQNAVRLEAALADG